MHAVHVIAMGARRPAPPACMVIMVLVALLAGCGPLPPEPVARGADHGASTTGFLGADDFKGEYLPVSHGHARGGKSTYHGRIVVTNVDRALVADLLPAGLQLAAAASAPLAQHPLIVLMGHQTDTAWDLGGGQLPVGQDYRELIALVPFVQRVGSSRWHNFIVRMYLDDFAALKIGNLHYGYAKQLATFGETPARFSTARRGVAMHTAESTALGGWHGDQDAGTHIPNYPALKQIFDMPVLGRLDYGTRRFVCSYFAWQYDATTVRPIDVRHTIRAPFVNAMARWMRLGELRSVSGGAVEVRDIDWRVAFPPHVCAF